MSAFQQPIGGDETATITYRVLDPSRPTNAVISAPEIGAVTLDPANLSFQVTPGHNTTLAIEMRPVPYFGSVYGSPVVYPGVDASGQRTARWVFNQSDPVAELLFTFAKVAISVIPPGPALTKFIYSFHTTSENKDADTEVLVQLIYNGVVIGQRQCFGVNHFDSDSDSEALDLPLTGSIGENQITAAVLRVSIKANGSDHWEFYPLAAAAFVGGGGLRWSFGPPFPPHGLESQDSAWNDSAVFGDYPLSQGIY